MRKFSNMLVPTALMPFRSRRRKEMKKILSFLIIIIWSVPAFALPSLQLDIAGGYYNKSGDPRYDDETLIAPGDEFTLYALMEEKENKTSLTDTYYLSMALFPGIDKTSHGPSLGFFKFLFNENTININVTEDMDYGDPGIPKHGVFPTYYYEYEFMFNPSNTVGEYNTQDNPGQFNDFLAGTGMYYTAFKFDTSNLSDNFSIHFDLFNDNTKAPFSHDAHDAQSDPPPIPEPTTLLLLSSGLIGLVGFRRKFRKT